jgi:hypothetical protein
MALDISGNWNTGDDLRLLEALLMPFSGYSLDCLQGCMGDLEVISADAVLRVLDILTDYEAAKAADAARLVADTEGKTLIQADVLKWQPNATGISGTEAQMNSLRGSLMAYFSFCPCVGASDGGFTGVTSLIRS